MLLLTGVVFMIAGIAFKFGAAPFHMWLPDVYHGAPTPITLFIGSAPKLAAFAMVVRLLGFGASPVSYTHLDVYKRQQLTLLASPTVARRLWTSSPSPAPLTAARPPVRRCGALGRSLTP